MTDLAVRALPRPLQRPAPSRVLGSDVGWVLAFLVLSVGGIWLHHGGLDTVTSGWTGAWTGMAQLTGLYASLAGLVGLVLVARPPSLEQRYGLDRMLIWHRYLGEAMALLIGAHVVAGVIEMSANQSVFGAVRDVTGRLPYMALATVGALAIGVVTISSLRSIRRQLAYETWYFVHLLAYAGLALSFAHEIVLGGDLASDRLARWYWVGLHVVAAAWLIRGRWGHLAAAAFRPLRVLSVTPVGTDSVAIVLGGPHLRTVRADAGQFAILRPLRPGLWWQAHPYSLSAAPSEAGLRFTIKDRGDASSAMATLPVGTRVIVEGPYGIVSPQVTAGQKVLLVAGGIGIAPVRAILERLGPDARPIVLYRARTDADLVHLDELQALAAARNGVVRTLVGPTAFLAVRDPFGAEQMRRAVPDLEQRVAVLCGPEALLHAARNGLRGAGMASRNIHFDRPWW